MLKNKTNREEIAKYAIEALNLGIELGSKFRIEKALSIVDDKEFSWVDLDELYLEWVSLLNDADDILLEDYL